MSKVILENTEKEISGFYYDIHRKNPMMKVTLHANTKPPSNILQPWPSWCNGGGAGSKKDEGFPYHNFNKPDIDESDSEDVIDFVIDKKTERVDVRYGALPIASSIINEDFNISIANSWTDFMGGQQLNEMFNSLKPLEAYANEIAPLFKTISGGFNEYIKENPDSFHNNKVSRTANSLVDHIGNSLGKSGNILSRSLVAQGTRFKFYSGTGISFSNLGMKFTLFADYIEELDENSDGSIKYTGTYKFKTPDEQLKMLLRYSIGEYTNLLKNGSLSSLGDGTLFKDSNGVGYTFDQIKEYIPGLNEQSTTSDLENIINTYLGWQLSPGGFRANVKYIDSVQTGTLMLKIGPYYRLKNLIIQDIQLNYSKHIAKYYDLETKSIKTCPLYCDVFITFSSATKYSDRMLKEFVFSRSRTEGNSPKSIESLEKTINSNIGF